MKLFARTKRLSLPALHQSRLNLSFAGLLFLCIVFLAWNARAALPATPEGAADIKAALERDIARLNTTHGAQGKTLNWDGELTVTPMDTYYAVTLPYLVIHSPDGEKLDIGKVSANISVEENGSWVVSMALPTPITVFDASGKRTAEVSIGNQRFSGIWWPEWNTYTKTDGAFEDIVVLLPETGEIRLGKIIVRTNLSEGNDGAWSGPGEFSLHNIAANFPGKLELKLESLAAKGTVKNFDIPAAATARKKIEDKIAEMDKSGQAPTSRELGALASQTFETFIKSGDEISSEITLGGFDLKIAARDTRPEKQVSLNTLHFTLGLKGFSRDMGEIAAGFGFQGFSSSALPPEIKDVFPRNANANVKIINLPFNKMLKVTGDAIGKTVETLAVTPPAATDPAATVELATSFPTILAEAGTQLTVENTYLETGLSKTVLEGNASASAQAAMGFVAEFLVAFHGLDRLMAAVSEGIKTSPQYAELQSMMMGLSMFQSLGKEETAETGEKFWTYHFETTESGQTLLNGTDIKALMIGGSGRPERPTAENGADPAQEPPPERPGGDL